MDSDNPPAKKPRTTILESFTRENVEVYVDRECANIEDILEVMKCGGKNVSFIGPKSCGKSTTLIRAYHEAKAKNMSAAFIDLDSVVIPDTSNFELSSMSRNVYFFIDNAQVFNERYMCDSDCKYLKALVAKCSRAMCLAFSPMVVERRGLSVVNFPFAIKKTMHFTPFTEQELTKFLAIMESEFNTKDLYELGAIPAIIDNAVSSSSLGEAKLLLLNHLDSAMRKLKSELPNEQHAKDVAKVLMQTCLYGCETLPLCDKALLINTGLVYATNISTNLTIEFTYPKQYVTHHVQSVIEGTFEIICSFSAGMAYEYRFFTRVQSRSVEMVCKGKKPSALKGKMTADKIIRLPKCDAYVQIKYGTVPSKEERNLKCTVIKLAESHVAIDFLILDNGGAKTCNTLYFIQVSSQKYQDRLLNRRLGAIKEKSAHTANKPPLNYYTTELEVEGNHCYYVYASPQVAMCSMGGDEDQVYLIDIKE